MFYILCTNIVQSGSPSCILIVLLISLEITPLPKSSILLTILFLLLSYTIYSFIIDIVGADAHIRPIIFTIAGRCRHRPIQFVFSNLLFFGKEFLRKENGGRFLSLLFLYFMIQYRHEIFFMR